MKTRLFFSLLALIFAFGVLGISLMDAHSVSSSGIRSASDRSLYFDKAMLPDHIMYPLFMAMDRVRLELAPRDERVFLEIEYANTRLLSGEELLDSKKESLAVSTFTKAEKYLSDATQDFQAQHGTDTMKRLLIKAINYHSKRLKALSAQMTDSDRSIIDQSLKQNTALLETLK